MPAQSPPPSRSRPRLRICPQRCGAAFVAIVVNGWFFHSVMTLTPALAPRIAAAPMATEVFWIIRSEPRATVDPDMRPSAPGTGDRASVQIPNRPRERPVPTAAPAGGPVTTVDETAAESRAVDGDDHWAPTGSAAAAAPGADPPFRRRPLSRPGPDPLAVEPRVTFAFEERSLRGHCAQLRALLNGGTDALAAQQTSREAVARSMQRDGCRF